MLVPLAVWLLLKPLNHAADLDRLPRRAVS